MKKTFFFTIMTAALIFTWGCGSSDDDDNNEPTPTPNPDSNQEVTWTKEDKTYPLKVDWSGNEPLPEWADMANNPDPFDYESWMILMVTLQDELATYASDDDFMGVFINNSLRALAKPAIFSGGGTNEVAFILKILGNENSEEDINFTLVYYCGKLKQTFTLNGFQKFVHEWVIGVEETFIIPLLEGCRKYPVYTDITMHFSTKLNDAIQPALGDMILVVVDGECRGTWVIDEHLFHAPAVFNVYGRQEGEKGVVYYYNARENTFWNTGTTITLKPGDQTIGLN